MTVDDVCTWFDIEKASRAFLEGAGPKVTLISIEIARPETRTIMATFEVKGRQGIFWTATMCGGGASQLDAKCWTLGDMAKMKAENLTS